ncbi:response regulator transcription factor [Paenibacillus koleovorans]|uniref:response regulator transcription factor n=1 Tax=Paenibacillus koleovorans TaxID=121608 RepID=UPI001FE89DCA|nr:response regulator transcription factor [Paenibacillus koleovorans]
MTKVLAIEDDPIIGEMIRMYLAEEGYRVLRVETAQGGLDALKEFEPDVVLLDLMLPDSAGSELCLKLRAQSEVPIIVVSTQTKVTERIQALTLGADDYLCKPFSMQELDARIQVVLRRAAGVAPLLRSSTASVRTMVPPPPSMAAPSASSAASAASLAQSAPAPLSGLAPSSATSATRPASSTPSPNPSDAAGFSPLIRPDRHIPAKSQKEPAIQVDAERRSITKQGEWIETTYSEYEVMKLFCDNPGIVFTREQLINAVRGIDSIVNDRAIDIHVTNLRKKIEADPKKPVHLLTVRGVGYKFNPY